jgi:hypothetical protein
MAADLWTGIKKILGTVAPILGNAIIPPLGGVVGALLAGVLGVDANDPAAISTALASATPDQLIKIKELENTHKERLLELGIERDKLYVQDVQNARQREIAVTQATGKKDIFLYTLAAVIVGGYLLLLVFMLALYYVYNKEIPSSTLTVAMFTTLATNFGLVIGYFFGSSKSSADKTALIAAMTPPEGK